MRLRRTAYPSPNGRSASPAALYEIGHDGDGFAFDNESPRAPRLRATRFEIASRLVTNGEYLAFIEDGGYDRAELWLSDGWATRRAEAWQAPLYWERNARTSGSSSRCRPAAARPGRAGLPRELLRGRRVRPLGRRAPADRGRVGDRGRAAPPVEGNFVESGRFHPSPRELPDRRTQLFGDVWEWTAQPLRRLPRLPARGRRAGRVQRQVHVQPDGAARRLVRHARGHIRADLPQLLPARRPLAVHRHPTGERTHP